MRGSIKGGSGDVQSPRDGSTTCAVTRKPAPAWHVHYMRSRSLSNRPRKPIQHSTFVPKTCFAQSEFLWRAISAARPVTLPTCILTVFPPLLHHSCCKQPASNSAGSLLSTCQLEVSFR